MTRQKKTPAQRAAETLAAANRRIDKLQKRRSRLQQELGETTRELIEAERARNYAAENPALQTADEDEAQPEAAAEDGA